MKIKILSIIKNTIKYITKNIISNKKKNQAQNKTNKKILRITRNQYGFLSVENKEK